MNDTLRRHLRTCVIMLSIFGLILIGIRSEALFAAILGIALVCMLYSLIYSLLE